MVSQDQVLPPQPDPTTGEPRPPKAPTYGRAPNETDASQGKPPSPPRGCSRALEWHIESNRKYLQAALWVVLLELVVFTVAEGLTWVGLWWVWVLIAVTPAIPYFGLRGTFYAAGTDWFRSKGGWVHTYALTTIRLEVSTKAVLTLQDTAGRGITVDITGIQINRRLWDLVYNGMRHSIVIGTATDVSNYAQSVLKLPKPQQR